MKTNELVDAFFENKNLKEKTNLLLDSQLYLFVEI